MDSDSVNEIIVLAYAKWELSVNKPRKDKADRTARQRGKQTVSGGEGLVSSLDTPPVTGSGPVN